MSDNRRALSRRSVLMACGATTFVSSFGHAAVKASQARPGFIAHLEGGAIELTALSDRAVRVRFVSSPSLATPASSILLTAGQAPNFHKTEKGKRTQLALTHLKCEWDQETACLSFYDRSGKLLLREAAGTRRLIPSDLRGEPVFEAIQGFESPDDERLYGTGCFQDGYLNIRGLPRRLTQVNTQISLPFTLSSKGYGLLWHNTGMCEINPASQPVVLKKKTVDEAAKQANVTTTAGNAQVTRRMATFEGAFSVDAGGPFAFHLDIGRKMASRHYVEIDGKPCTDLTNLWLPPTASFVTELLPGDHKVRVLANDNDAPLLNFDTVRDRTVWRSPVADAIDYVVVAGPSAAEVMAGYRDIIGETPIMPKWAFGYIHCRERFHSSDEILETAKEFRRRKLPVDVVVQDWQYWGKYGWNAMKFDEAFYPDPGELLKGLHGMNMRFMLSVWSKISRETDLGKECAREGYYIPQTDWVDFFNPKAAAFYWENQKSRLASLGIDAWWQDATEPENDDLTGRVTAAGPGERVRLTYPVQVARTVYQGQRRDFPDRRVMVLTRSAFPGQQRYAAATWSGDIGNDWETLRRQIPAGLNMAAAGYPYWTVDAGGFFRPGAGQYTDPDYHERFLRWFQYATFLPLQRVHGYMTDTEFWRYGETVERISRGFLELRYRLLPYTYSLASEANQLGLPIIRPLVFDFADDTRALDQTHSYMYGAMLHVAPVLVAGAEAVSVYLPKTPGGWFDFWTGEQRAGGLDHSVATPLSQLPLHVRAGSILPVGPVVQSTADADGMDINLFIYPGRDGAFDLYEDDGLTYEYERQARSNIPIVWDDLRGEVRFGERKGRFTGMLMERRFKIFRASTKQTPLQALKGIEVVYTGKPLKVSLSE